MQLFRSAVCVAGMALAACGVDDAQEGVQVEVPHEESAARDIPSGDIQSDESELISPEEASLLTVANDATIEQLVTAGIDASVAERIVAYRNGPDAQLFTEDDQMFETLDEVQAALPEGDLSTLTLLFEASKKLGIAPPELHATTMQQLPMFVNCDSLSESDRLDAVERGECPRVQDGLSENQTPRGMFVKATCGSAWMFARRLPGKRIKLSYGVSSTKGIIVFVRATATRVNLVSGRSARKSHTHPWYKTTWKADHSGWIGQGRSCGWLTGNVLVASASCSIAQPFDCTDIW